MLFRIRIATGEKKEFCIAVLNELPAPNTLQSNDKGDNPGAMDLLKNLQGAYIDYENRKITDYKTNKIIDWRNKTIQDMNSQAVESIDPEGINAVHKNLSFVIHSEPANNQHKIYIQGTVLEQRSGEPQYHFDNLSAEQFQSLKTLLDEACTANPAVFGSSTEEFYIHQPLFFAHYESQLPPGTIIRNNNVVLIKNSAALQNGVVCNIRPQKLLEVAPARDNEADANHSNAAVNNNASNDNIVPQVSNASINDNNSSSAAPGWYLGEEELKGNKIFESKKGNLEALAMFQHPTTFETNIFNPNPNNSNNKK